MDEKQDMTAQELTQTQLTEPAPVAPAPAPAPVAHAAPPPAPPAPVTDLAGIVDDSRIEEGDWFPYDSFEDEYEGFQVKLVVVNDMKEIRKLQQKCRYKQKDAMSGRRVEKFDDEKFTNLLAQKTVKGWKGLTVGYFKQLLTLPDDAIGPGITDDTPVAFNPANLFYLIEKSPDFVDFCGRCTATTKSYNDMRLRESEGNS